MKKPPNCKHCHGFGKVEKSFYQTGKVWVPCSHCGGSGFKFPPNKRR